MTSGSTQTPLDGLSAFDGTGLNDLSVTVRKPTFDGCESHGLILLSFCLSRPKISTPYSKLLTGRIYLDFHSHCDAINFLPILIHFSSRRTGKKIIFTCVTLSMNQIMGLVS